jgi:hypothetical protein
MQDSQFAAPPAPRRFTSLISREFSAKGRFVRVLGFLHAAVGHSRPGRADSRSSHVRHAPIAIKFCAAEQFLLCANKRHSDWSRVAILATEASEGHHGFYRHGIEGAVG